MMLIICKLFISTILFIYIINNQMIFLILNYGKLAMESGKKDVHIHLGLKLMGENIYKNNNLGLMIIYNGSI